MMIDPQIAGEFITASALLALAPGPDNIFVLAQGAQNGARAGVMVVLGLATGLIGHTIAVAAGLAALLAASPTAFNILSLIGAAYLLWLAYGAWRASGVVEITTAQTQSAHALYLRGVIMNITNPKVTLFMLAFLPRFISPEKSSAAWQSLQLGALMILVTLLVFGTIALGAGRIGDVFRRNPRAGIWLNRIAALTFTALALSLIVKLFG